GRPERRRDASLAADVDDQCRREQERDESEDAELPPGQPCHGCSAGRDIHREPPSWERPGGPLPPPAGPPEDVVDVVGIGGPRQVAEDGRKVALVAHRRGHATCPPCAGDGSSGPVSTAMRISPSARWSRDLTVPIGMPRVAATSVSGIPKK